MSKKRLVILLAGVGLIAVVGLVIWTWVTQEDPHVRRGKELLSIDEYASAAKEFKIYLKKSGAQDTAAKAMLLYALLRSEQNGVEGLKNMLSMQLTLAVFLDEKWSRMLNDEKRENVKKALIKWRRGLFEMGLDTKDGAELSHVLLDLAKFVMTESDQDASKDMAAHVLAGNGNAEAVQYLIERLKGSNITEVETSLVRLGRGAASALKNVVQDPEHLGREQALRALSKVLVTEEAKRVFAAYPSAQGVSIGDLPEPLRTANNERLLETQFVEGITRLLVEQGIWVGSSNNDDNRDQLHTAFFPSMKTSERGMLVLSGKDPQGIVFSRLFLFEHAQYRPLYVTMKGQGIKGFEGDSPIVRVRIRDDSIIELSKPEMIPVEVEKLSGMGRSTPGSRVSIQGYKGTVQSKDDADLVTIKLDTPVGGQTHLVTLANRLRGLVKKTAYRAGYRVFAARLQDNTLSVREDLFAIRETLDGPDLEANQETPASLPADSKPKERDDHKLAAVPGDTTAPSPSELKPKEPSDHEEASSVEGMTNAILDDAIDPQKAIELTKQAAEQFGHVAHRPIAVAANSRGHRLYQSNHFDDALQFFVVASSLDPTYGMPRYNAARIYAIKGDIETCVSYLLEIKKMGRGQSNRLNQARTDDGFKNAWDDPRFVSVFDGLEPN